MITIVKRWTVVAVALLFAFCCTPPEEEGTYTLSLAKTAVSYASGSHMLSVSCSDNAAWSLNLNYQGSASDWVSLSVTEGEGSKSSIVLAYDVNYETSSRSVYIELIVNGSEVDEILFTQAARTGSTTSREENSEEENSSSDEDNSLSNEDSSSEEQEEVDNSIAASNVPTWMELPAMSDDDGLKFYTHPMTLSGTLTRNFSFYWCAEEHLSYWVAYPLNAWLISSGSRSNDWAYDPLVPESEQANLTRSYSGNYDRGHQCPSADRYATAANKETFYFTNMTPQLADLNQNIWADLESMVRTWSKNSDTLYVVTGALMEGWTQTTTDADNKACPLPVGYYKALLRYSKASTLGFSGYLGAAFYLEHKAYGTQSISSSMSMSIDALEELTGIDFFPNLVDAIGSTAAANVEKQSPADVNWWWN